MTAPVDYQRFDLKPNVSVARACAWGRCWCPLVCEPAGYCGELNITHGLPQFSERLPDGCYQAWVGDYDLDITTGYGKTQREAAIDLMDKLEDRS